MQIVRQRPWKILNRVSAEDDCGRPMLWRAALNRAAELSRKHTPKFGTRSLDVLHALHCAHGRMGGDQPKGPFEKRSAGLDPVPGRGARGMRQGHEVEFQVQGLPAPTASDHSFEFVECQELLDGQAPNGNHQAGTENLQLAFQPEGAVFDFVRGRDAITASRFLARETAANCSHVNGLPEVRLFELAAIFEPAEQGFAGCPGEGPAQDRLLVAGRLSHEHYFAQDRSAADNRFVHLRAAPARQQFADMGGQPFAGAERGDSFRFSHTGIIAPFRLAAIPGWFAS
jgi:hypothetical protein